MPNLNEKAQQNVETDTNPSARPPFGQGHEEITDDISALLDVFGLQGFSRKLKQNALKMIRR